MGALAIRQVRYSGDKYHFTSPEFDSGLSIVEGPNGSGKSTFFNLIYFALGGRVPEFEINSTNAHKEIVGDTNNMVNLIISVNSKLFGVTRRIGQNSISISPLGDSMNVPTETLPVFRKDAEQRTFSDWLLDELEIPVVEITQGTRTFKLNFPDLARLIFHNQSPDPHGVFKPADVSNNFISDSLEVRRAIFQILVGKTLHSLYLAYARLKRAERDREAAKLIHKEYKDIVAHISRSNGINQVVNSAHLLARISELNEQLEKLTAERAVVLGGRIQGNEIVISVEVSKKDFELAMQHKSKLDAQLQALFSEKARLDEVRAVLRDDISRIEKIIYTHKQLKLFSADTCPYCLSTVERAANKCVCGSAVNESQYQRFFYSATEYAQILASKTKSLQTLDQAGKDIRDEIDGVAQEQSVAAGEVQSHRAKFALAADIVSSAWSPDERLEQIQEKIAEVRDRIGELQQALLFENKLDVYQRQLNAAARVVEEVRAEVNSLDAASRQELAGRIADFDLIYAEMMQAVLRDCRDAHLDTDTYLPVINNGEYREASADVPKRFLYYLTMLAMSADNAIPFPNLLLIDTPETAGIDRENLIKNFRQISRLPDTADFQILLSTGINKYPTEYQDRVKIRLSDDSKLLRDNSARMRA